MVESALNQDIRSSIEVAPDAAMLLLFAAYESHLLEKLARI